MSTQRIALLICLLGATTASCTGQKAAESTLNNSPELNVAVNGSTNKSASTTLVARSPSEAARKQADMFLSAMVRRDFAAAREMTTTSFRKLVSGSLTFEDERKLGYSNSDTEKYLSEMFAKTAAPKIATIAISPPELSRSEGAEVSIRGPVGEKPESGSFALRLTNEGNRWLVSRFATTRAIYQPIERSDSKPAKDSTHIWAQESARDFLDGLIGGHAEQALTMDLMTEDFKAKLPSPSIPEPGLNYAKKDVRAWLNGTRLDAQGYSITGFARDGDECMFSGELTGGSRARAFKLTVNGQWKIDGFEVKP